MYYFLRREFRRPLTSSSFVLGPCWVGAGNYPPPHAHTVRLEGMGCDGCFGRCPDALGGHSWGSRWARASRWAERAGGCLLSRLWPPVLVPPARAELGPGSGCAGAPCRSSGFPGKLCPFWHDPGGEKTVVCKRATSASSCTSTTSPGCLSATLLQVRWVMPLPGAAPRPEEGEGGLGGALQRPRWQTRPPCFSNPLEKLDLSSEPCPTALSGSGT